MELVEVKEEHAESEVASAQPIAMAVKEEAVLPGPSGFGAVSRPEPKTMPGTRGSLPFGSSAKAPPQGVPHAEPTAESGSDISPLLLQTCKAKAASEAPLARAQSKVSGLWAKARPIAVKPRPLAVKSCPAPASAFAASPVRDLTSAECSSAEASSGKVAAPAMPAVPTAVDWNAVREAQLLGF